MGAINRLGLWIATLQKNKGKPCLGDLRFCGQDVYWLVATTARVITRIGRFRDLPVLSGLSIPTSTCLLTLVSIHSELVRVEENLL